MIYKNDCTLPNEYPEQLMERLSQEIKRRTRIVRVFPNEQSCLRLISAILMETNEEWEYGRIYLNLEST